MEFCAAARLVLADAGRMKRVACGSIGFSLRARSPAGGVHPQKGKVLGCERATAKP